MMNIQLLIGVFLLSLLVGTESTGSEKEKSSSPESERQITDDEFSWTAWPMSHHGAGGLEEIFGSKASQQMPPSDQSGQRLNLQPYNHIVYGGTSGSAATLNVPQAQPTVGLHLHNFEPSISESDYDIFHALKNGKPPLEQRDDGITGKWLANEFIVPQIPEIRREERSHHEGNEEKQFMGGSRRSVQNSQLEKARNMPLPTASSEYI
jgi:hypothetical protein